MSRLALVFAVLVACNKADPGPSCAAVVDHMQAIMKEGPTGHGGAELGDRKMMIDACEKRQMPKATRQCLLAAKDITRLAACSTSTPAPRPSAPVVPPAGSATAPAGSATPPP